MSKMSIQNKEIILKTNKTLNYLHVVDKKTAIPTLFLHGFTGSHKSWDSVVSKLALYSITLDLPGHGKSIFKDLNNNYSIDDWCDDFRDILIMLDIDKINICGYSMGGRLGVAFASKYPNKINKLILESSSIGIGNFSQKDLRFQSDLALCNSIESDLPKFMQKWKFNTLFENQLARNKEGSLKQEKERLKHDPMQLSKALRSFSQGNMKYYREEISSFKFPILIINGLDDREYVKKGKFIASLNTRASHCIIKNAGHNVHLESVDEFINTLNNYLNDI